MFFGYTNIIFGDYIYCVENKCNYLPNNLNLRMLCIKYIVFYISLLYNYIQITMLLNTKDNSFSYDRNISHDLKIWDLKDNV